METIKYTFLLPAYKSCFFAEALQSIKGQIYTDFKVIVSDDCSPEDLKCIFDREVGDDPRFMYRRNKENMGSKSLVSHWNLLVDMCDTEYLIMASDDDVYEPSYLEEIDFLVENYLEVNLFRGRMRKIDAKGELLLQDMMLEEYQSQIDFLYYFFHFDILKCIANYTFKTSELRKQGGFYDLPLAWGSDDATVVMLSKNGVCNTPSLSFSFRSSGINISTKKTLFITREKTRGRYGYVKFLDNYLPRLRENLKTKMDGEQYKAIEDAIYNGLYIKSIFVGAELSPFKEMLTYFKYLSQKRYFKGRLDKIHFFWSWIRAYKTRKELCR